MQSIPKPKPSDDPHDIVVIALDAVRVAPAEEEFSTPAPNAVRIPSAPQIHVEPIFMTGKMTGQATPPVDSAFRATGVNAADVKVTDADATDVGEIRVKSRRGREIVRRAMRAVSALVLAACIGGAAMAWRYHGEAIQRTIVEWAPLFAQKSSQPPLEKTGLAAQPAPAAAEVDGANAPPKQPASQPPAATEAASPAAAAAAPSATAAVLAPDEPQSLETMARDLANANHEIEQLKASVEQLKASQQQLVAMISDKEKAAATQNLRPKKPAPPRPGAALASPPRKPQPVQQSSLRQATPIVPSAAAAPVPTAGPYVPRQVPQSQTAVETLDDPELVSVPRPPMPLR